MQKNRAFAIILFVTLLLVIYGLCVMIAGADLYQNRPRIQEAPFRKSVFSYAAREGGGWA